MTELTFDGTFDSWRHIARHALSQGLHPSAIQWRSTDDSQQALFSDTGVTVGGETAPHIPSHTMAFHMSRRTLMLLKSASCHRDPERWNLLYRIVWRLTHGEPKLMEDVLDTDVRRLLRMDKQIRRDVHKMHAFVRFRKVILVGEDSRYVAWFEPAHNIVLYAAPFFVRRFPSMCWSILTQNISVHWNRHSLEQGPGMSRRDAPGGDDVEKLWTTYYANIFNPARVKRHTMYAEMPKRYWVNLPEALLIGPLVRNASTRVARFWEANIAVTADKMSVDEPSEPSL